MSLESLAGGDGEGGGGVASDLEHLLQEMRSSSGGDEAQLIAGELGEILESHRASLTSQVSLKLSVDRDGVCIRFLADSGREYLIETSTNFTDWQPLGEAVNQGNGEFEFIDGEMVGRRFYRVLLR